jgi:4-amino-4-deoxy-L-arabinose transferase-like glycosyltransferase
MSLRNSTVLFVSVLILVAAPARLMNLGALSFYADEETSAMPARSLAEGNGARMPTGMEYRRALPLTWLNAATARAIGLDNDVSYRLPTAVLGILTVPLFFIAVRQFGVGTVAFLAALLFAVSEWHLVFSRQARMYVPFLLFFIAGAWAIWNWAETGKQRWLLLAVPMAAGAVSMHQLGIMISMFAVLPLIVPGRHEVSTSKLVALAVIVTAAGWIYHEYFIQVPYRAWLSSAFDVRAAADSAAGVTVQTATPGPWLVILGIIGGGAGLLTTVMAIKADRGGSQPLGQLAVVISGAAAGALAWTGQLYGACMAGVISLILLPGDRSVLIKQARIPIVLIAIPAIVWLVVVVLGQGPREGLKAVSAFPYPYPLYLAYQFPLILLLFGAVCVVVAMRAATQGDRPLRAALLAGLLPIVAVGAVSRWGGTRYLFAAYPFLLLVASCGLVWLVAWVGKRLPRWTESATLALGTLVVLSGALGGHGLPQAARVVRLGHGEPVNEAVHMYPFRPDHASAGLYVREQRSERDIVIAEDPLQQWWYAGSPIDYWLRSYSDSRGFLSVTEEGRFRDIYVGSELLEVPLPVDSLLASPEGRVWLITSGENLTRRSYYLNVQQGMWLDSLENALVPSFVARDRATKVYCLNCPGQ